jgi:hypothetical protein
MHSIMDVATVAGSCFKNNAHEMMVHMLMSCSYGCIDARQTPGVLQLASLFPLACWSIRRRAFSRRPSPGAFSRWPSSRAFFGLLPSTFSESLLLPCLRRQPSPAKPSSEPSPVGPLLEPPSARPSSQAFSSRAFDASLLWPSLRRQPSPTGPSSPAFSGQALVASLLWLGLHWSLLRPGLCRSLLWSGLRWQTFAAPRSLHLSNLFGMLVLTLLLNDAILAWCRRSRSPTVWALSIQHLNISRAVLKM